jgi:hypothetical protein
LCFRATYLNAALAYAASDGVGISTGDEQIYIKFKVYTSGSALVRLFEGPTITASATLATYNANRYLGGSGTLSISSASTGTSPDFAAAARGTMLWESHIASIGAFGGAGTQEDDVGWILNRNSKYMLCASNLQGTTGGTGFQLIWYTV